MKKLKIGINGFGRIGKSILQIYAAKHFPNLKIAAINFASGNLQKHLHFLKYDSIHGHFPYAIQIDEKTFNVKEDKIKAVFTRNIHEIDWETQGVDLVLECSGIFNSRELSYKHIKSGAKKIIVSAPCKEADSTIVYGVNTESLSPNDEIISAGSCTTNCLAPIVKVLHEAFDIEHGFMTTIHSYTNDQRLLDGSHKDLRRARAANLSIIPTTTGAAKSIGLVLPELSGKLDGAAVRVPVPNVSMIDFKFTCNKKISSNDINFIMKDTAKNKMKGVVDVSNEELVSIDFNNNLNSAIFDTTQTKVIDNKFGRIVAWYDNEWGFACRMLDIAQFIATRFAQ